MIAKIVARADVNAVDMKGSSALHKAASLGNDRLVAALIKVGANLNLAKPGVDGDDYVTALDEAIEEKKTTTAALLRKSGAKTYAELK